MEFDSTVANPDEVPNIVDIESRQYINPDDRTDRLNYREIINLTMQRAANTLGSAVSFEDVYSDELQEIQGFIEERLFSYSRYLGRQNYQFQHQTQTSFFPFRILTF